MKYIVVHAEIKPNKSIWENLRLHRYKYLSPL